MPATSQGEEGAGITSRDKVFTEYEPGGRSDEQLEGLEKLLKESPDDPDILDWLAFSHYSAGSNARAVELYEHLLRVVGENASYRYYLGNLHYRLDDAARARKEWNACLAAPDGENFREKVAERLALLEG